MANVEFDRIYHQTRETFMEAVATRNPKRVHIYKSMPKFVAGDALEKQCMNRLGFDEDKVFKDNPVAIYGFSFFGLDGSFHRLSDI